jgi:predicted Zn-dependent protease
METAVPVPPAGSDPGKEHTVTKLGRLLAAPACAACLLAGCATAPAGPAQGTDPSESASGRVLAQVGEEFAFVWDPETLSIVREIGDTLARAYGASSETYHLYIVNDPGLNAFCTPSGDIFIYSGELARLRSEDELAAVLAHEMAHKEADHFARISRQSALVMLPTLAALILSRGEAAVAVGAIAVASAYQLSFSREMETEADLRAINALKRTPYDPLGMAGALAVIEQADQLAPSQNPDHLSSHPPVEIRRASLESVLGKPLRDVGWKPVAGPRWLRLRDLVTGVSGDPPRILAAWKEQSAGYTPADRRRAGLVLLKAGFAREATQELRRARDEGQGDDLLPADLGAALYQSGEYKAARPLLEEARRARPDYAYPLYYLAELERESGGRRQAEVLYLRALDARPELPEAFARYGELLAEEGREGEASYCQGVAALLGGRFREAVALLEEARKTLGEKPYWRERIESRLGMFK